MKNVIKSLHENIHPVLMLQVLVLVVITSGCAVSDGKYIELPMFPIIDTVLLEVENGIDISVIGDVVQENGDNYFEVDQQDETPEPIPAIPEEQPTTSTEETSTYVTVLDMQISTSQTRLEAWGALFTTEEIEPLRYLTNLTYLNLSSITTQFWMEAYSLFDSPYDFPDIPILDISSLAELTSLTSLSLCGQNIIDISPLADLENLTFLSLKLTTISDISHLEGLTNLTILNLNGTSINDLSPLANLTNLETLYLCGFITDATFCLEPLANLTNLRVLEINSRQINDITPLAGLANLQILSLRNNQINDITPLAGLENLRYLDFTEKT